MLHHAIERWKKDPVTRALLKRLAKDRVAYSGELDSGRLLRNPTGLIDVSDVVGRLKIIDDVLSLRILEDEEIQDE